MSPPISAAVVEASRDDRSTRHRYRAIGTIIAVLGLVVPFFWETYLRALPALELPAADAGSVTVLDRDGRLLRAFTTASGRWRLPIDVADVDPRFLQMLLAYEDHRYFVHSGVDWVAVARALGQVFQKGRVVSGASTLTMQVARLLEPRRERSLTAKARQMLRAKQLESRLSKQDILRLYLALAPYGGNLEGLRAGSLAYFGREPKRLTLSESALLVAVPQAPEERRPDRFPATAQAARDRVLDRAVAAGVITPAEALLAKREPAPRERRPFPSLAAHVSEAIVRANPSRRVFHLSIDARLQAALETLAAEGVARIGPHLSAAIIAIDNRSGEVRAHVGSANYLDDERAGAIDMTGAQRSPGSALKPFIYAMAFEYGIAHPETMLEDRPARYGAYVPENFDLTFQGTVTARRALQGSLNVPAVALLNAIGPMRFLARLRQAGARITMPDDAPPGLAIALGGLGISLFDVARLYCGFARGGSVPHLIEDKDARDARRETSLTEPVAAWYVADILRGVPPPTNARAGILSFKTGTSYGYRDAWAIGFDKRTTLAVWIGRPDNAAVPGLVAHDVAAPLLFDAFARTQNAIEPIAPPPNVIVARNSTLPPPLRHLRADLPKTTTATNIPVLKIAYPPDGADVDVGLTSSGMTKPSANPLVLKAQGGVPPLLWLVNGVPIGVPDLRRQAIWHPDGAGFARVSVMDSNGATDSVSIRLE
jgi:penicillin-binding protein 1C